jgi:hypothetical protein
MKTTAERVGSDAYPQVLGVDQSNGNIEIEATWPPYWIPRWPRAIIMFENMVFSNLLHNDYPPSLKASNNVPGNSI